MQFPLAKDWQLVQGYARNYCLYYKLFFFLALFDFLIMNIITQIFWKKTKNKQTIKFIFKRGNLVRAIQSSRTQTLGSPNSCPNSASWQLTSSSQISILQLLTCVSCLHPIFCSDYLVTSGSPNQHHSHNDPVHFLSLTLISQTSSSSLFFPPVYNTSGSEVWL